jgi:hypothetical protein
LTLHEQISKDSDQQERLKQHKMSQLGELLRTKLLGLSGGWQHDHGLACSELTPTNQRKKLQSQCAGPKYAVDWADCDTSCVSSLSWLLLQNVTSRCHAIRLRFGLHKSIAWLLQNSNRLQPPVPCCPRFGFRLHAQKTLRGFLFWLSLSWEAQIP